MDIFNNKTRYLDAVLTVDNTLFNKLNEFIPTNIDDMSK